MKQNKSIRLMSILMILVMLSSIYASTTIARFSDVVQSSDTTRVAIWDINANEVTMDLFNTVYTDEETGNTLAKSHNTENIIAPGTHGTSLFSIVNHIGDIAPEVMYYIQIDLDDSNVSNDIITNQYIQWKLDNGSWGTWDQLKQSIYMLTGDPSGVKTYQAGEFANAFKKGLTHSISWQWLEDDIGNNTMTDEEDYIAKIAVKVTARQTSTVYGGVVEGANNIVNVNEDIEPVVVKSSAPMNELVEVQVNGEVIERDVDYTVTEGSTIITLTESYLKTLPVGGYNISVVSQKQVATAKLDVVDRVYNTPGTDGDEPIVHNGIIPEGGTYYVGVTTDYPDIGDYDSATEVLTAGQEFPDEVNTGDVYVYGDYEYRYNMEYEGRSWSLNDGQNGWGVKVLDRSKSFYGEILTAINKEDIVSLSSTFYGCSSLVNAPTIPSSVTDMNSTFNGCASLVNAPVIPSGVTGMAATFAICTSLVNAPVIPENVEDMWNAFWNCTNLTGTIEINANPTVYSGIFNNTFKPITLTGSSTILNELSATATNGNVSVGNGVGGGDESVVSSVLSENSWETISTVTKAGEASNYWSVGDKTTVDVNGTDYEVVIADFNHDGDNTITFVFNEDVTTTAMNSDGCNQGSWKDSDMRNITMDTILSQMENKYLLKEVEKQTIKGGYDACSLFNEKYGYCETVDSEKAYELVTTNDKLFLLSYTEVFGNQYDAAWDDFNEGTQYEYFKTPSNRIIEPDEDGYGVWWLRTPIGVDGDDFYLVDDGGSNSNDIALNDYSVVPAFVIG